MHTQNRDKLLYSIPMPNMLVNELRCMVAHLAALTLTAVALIVATVSNVQFCKATHHQTEEYVSGESRGIADGIVSVRLKPSRTAR